MAKSIESTGTASDAGARPQQPGAANPPRGWLVDLSWRDQLRGTLLSLALVAGLTVLLTLASTATGLTNITVIYLIPVIIAATRWGIAAAVIAAVASVAASAFFFYPPLYDFRVSSTQQVVDLLLFIFVAVITGQLAASVRKAKMRRQADALREAVIDSVSHELRTPLSTIMGSASVLALSPEVAGSSRLSPLVRGLQEAADRLNDHIQNLLDATRINTEGIRPRIEWVDPGDIVNFTVERKRALLEGREVDVAVADDLPLTLTDPSLIEKALGQLIENAIKYSPPHSAIRITVEAAGDAVRIGVRDQGSGFAPDERELLWHRFYRSPQHRDQIPGSGLGLWIARALVTACGGRVEAFSEGVGRGATVSIYLPARRHAEEHRFEAADE
jgi:K+-sensing histidine kinase KdpD